MKNYLRLMGPTRSFAIWFVGFSAILVLFPFEWLRNIWPAYALCPAQASLPSGANPDGWYTVIGYISTADVEGTVRVWGNDGKYIALQSHSPVHQIAWSPDGNFLAAAHADGTVQVWQAPLSDIPAIWRNM